MRKIGAYAGMGPAYFTKLIYFLLPRNLAPAKRGYIMDQWVGCSVNLICGREIVKMNSSYSWGIDRKGLLKKSSSFIVADVNSSSDYSDFCEALAKLSKELNFAPDFVDRALMSEGGRKKKAWRKYVIENRTF
jgi:hypothetical protein